MSLFLVALAVVSLAAFFATGAHRRRTTRVAQAGPSLLLSVPLMEYGLWALQPLARAATALRLSPDLLSWVSLAFHALAGLELAKGDFEWSVAWLLLGGACDSLDGAVARALGKASAAGEVLDAVVDRWSEMAVLFGLAYHYRAFPLGFWLALAAASGSLMVSYTRAKAQAMGVSSGGGLMQRHERAIVLILGVLLSALLRHVTSRHTDWPLLGALGLIGALSTVASLVRTSRLRATLRTVQ